MIKLYRKNSVGLEYWETWENKGEYTIHWGQAGDRGKTDTVRGSFLRSAEKVVAASADGRVIAAGGDDGTLRVWDGMEKKSLFRFAPN